VWYGTSRDIVGEFDTIGKNLKFVKLFPNPHPFYDWIMGFYERWSNRAALRGPVLERVTQIIEAGVGTGHLLSQLVRKTGGQQNVTALDLSGQMLRNARRYLVKHGLLAGRVRFEQADCTRLPHPDAVFDLYVSSYLFDLLNDEEIPAALREMERVLMTDGHAILITMTTELDDLWWPSRMLCRILNELYCLGYHRGRWNRVWKFLFAGYAPHCRPIALGRYLREFPALAIEYTKVSHVTLFPVRIYYVRKSHA
jgi:ubiquinone/menaquinone biosynthesis C-methylase UbiE